MMSSRLILATLALLGLCGLVAAEIPMAFLPCQTVTNAPTSCSCLRGSSACVDGCKALLWTCPDGDTIECNGFRGGADPTSYCEVSHTNGCKIMIGTRE